MDVLKPFGTYIPIDMSQVFQNRERAGEGKFLSPLKLIFDHYFTGQRSRNGNMDNVAIGAASVGMLSSRVQ